MGQGDENMLGDTIFAKVELKNQYKKKYAGKEIQVLEFTADLSFFVKGYLDAFSKGKLNDYLTDKNNFMYYKQNDSNRKHYYSFTDSFVNDEVNLKIRQKLNDNEDMYLPINPNEAQEIFGFTQTPGDAFHNPPEKPKINSKYIHVDGREAIYHIETGKLLTLKNDGSDGENFGPREYKNFSVNKM